jgi:hypothetical protein
MWKVRKNRSRSRRPSLFFFLSPFLCDLMEPADSSLCSLFLSPTSFDGVLSSIFFPKDLIFSSVTISLLACSPDITSSCYTLMKHRVLIPIESRLKGVVNRQNLKIINFEHALHPGLGLEINYSEFGVRKIVLLVMSCSINVDYFGSQLKTI